MLYLYKILYKLIYKTFYFTVSDLSVLCKRAGSKERRFIDCADEECVLCEPHAVNRIASRLINNNFLMIT